MLRRMTFPSQNGVSLIELMVGIAIGLLTVAVAMGALMASRNVSGTVSDASVLQQQASYLMRVMSTQLRQAGSLRLNLGIGNPDGDAMDPREPVALEYGADGFDPMRNTLSGNDSPTTGQYKLMTGFRNYTEQLFGSDTRRSQMGNCLGQQNSAALIQSAFKLNGNNELVCAGESTPEPLARNVANFTVRYLLQDDPGFAGRPEILYTNAASVDNRWGQVVAVEVCLVLYGTQPMDLPGNASYTDCPAKDGSMAQQPLNQLKGVRHQRLHMAFRNIYQLRSQGVSG